MRWLWLTYYRNKCQDGGFMMGNMVYIFAIISAWYLSILYDIVEQSQGYKIRVNSGR